MSWDELQAMAFAYLLRSQLEKFLLQEVFVVQETLLSPVGPRDFETKKLKNIYFKFKTPLKVKPLLEKFAERSADMDADTDITKFWIADTDADTDIKKNHRLQGFNVMRSILRCEW